MFILERKSQISGEINLMNIDMNEQEFFDRHDIWARGELIQNAFPTLSPDEREFIKTGITPSEWEGLFPED